MDAQVPFSRADALNRETLAGQPLAQRQPPKEQNFTESITYVPGDLSIGPDEVRLFISKNLRTLVLDELYERLWFVARKCGRSIDPLHTQKVKGRTIVPTEDPNLHLVWDRDKIYIKPVPIFLLNHDFWLTYLRDPDHRSDHLLASGFMRSYGLLIQSPLDFALAKESHLMPKSIEWLPWSKFISYFRNIEDFEVAKRYHYGQLRLSRLHWAVRFFRPQNASTLWFYVIPHWSVTEFVERATVPLLFVFASLSLVLSSMQVVLSVPVEDLWYDDSSRSSLRQASRAFWGFSITVIIFAALTWVLIVGIPAAALLWQMIWGFQHRNSGQAG